MPIHLSFGLPGGFLPLPRWALMLTLPANRASKSMLHFFPLVRFRLFPWLCWATLDANEWSSGDESSEESDADDGAMDDALHGGGHGHHEHDDPLKHRRGLKR